MRKLWECKDWTLFVSDGCRSGIRLCFDKEVDKEVKRACKEFVYWLKKRYEFPVRVPVYFKASKEIMSSDGRIASALFFWPYDRKEEPYIKVAVGDYQEMLRERGKDNALAAILHSIAHELSHYYQWLKKYEYNEKRMERQAKYYAKELIYDYAETREHP